MVKLFMTIIYLFAFRLAVIIFIAFYSWPLDALCARWFSRFSIYFISVYSHSQTRRSFQRCAAQKSAKNRTNARLSPFYDEIDLIYELCKWHEALNGRLSKPESKQHYIAMHLFAIHFREWRKLHFYAYTVLG